MAVRALEMDEEAFLSMWPEMPSGPEAVFICGVRGGGKPLNLQRRCW